MRRLILILLLVPGCCTGQEDSAQNNATSQSSTPAGPIELTALEIGVRAAVETKRGERQQRELEHRVRRAMEPDLFDPFSAQYRNVRAGRNGAVCGQFNAKNRYGAYVGFKNFVVGRDGRTIYTSRFNDGVRTELYTSFAEAYLNVCASRAEAAQYRATTGIPNPAYLRSDPAYDMDTNMYLE